MSKTCPLDGRKTNCTDNCIACLDKEVAFGNAELKSRVDAMCKLANEIMGMSKDISEYTDDENNVLDEIANFINAYHNAFT